MGENITTEGVDLLALSRRTVLTIGTAEIEITGLRNPCSQLDDLHDGLISASHRANPRQWHRCRGRCDGCCGDRRGSPRCGNAIDVTPPTGPFIPLERV